MHTTMNRMNLIRSLMLASVLPNAVSAWFGAGTHGNTSSNQSGNKSASSQQSTQVSSSQACSSMRDGFFGFIGGAMHDFRAGMGLDTGCTLEVPNEVMKHKEAVGKPLMIQIEFKILTVRDIPDQGGSFGVDIK